MAKPHSNDWWRGAAFYQVYPRSFQDCNGDGVGDLAGITARMPYLANLGVDGIWVLPFYQSPMADFGYDIADHCAVDPLFGKLEDFDRLIDAAQRHGLRVLIDLVLSHTSDQHPWFVESRSSRNNPKADWYVWSDPKPDGNPPNNWLSVFGGSAWQWDTRRQQYYLHHFLTSQPCLNFHSQAVQDAVLDVGRFWLERGVSGFRLETVNFYLHDEQLRSNPPMPPGQFSFGAAPNNPYSRQKHLYDKTQPGNLDFLRRMRDLVNQYPGATLIGEIDGEEQYRIISDYTAGGDKLHMAYTYCLLVEDGDPRHLHARIDECLRESHGAWLCWALNNHDITRVLTRWSAQGQGEDFAAVLFSLLSSLRGSISVYQGEELGLSDVNVAYEDIRDPYGKAMWPEFKGRDGCRTPMPWRATDRNAGFSLTHPWLPIPPDHVARSVDIQGADTVSLLNRYRAQLHWRKQHPALITGDIELLPAHDQVIGFIRRHPQESVVCLFNLSGQPAEYNLPAGLNATSLAGQGFTGQIAGNIVTLPPYQAAYGSLPSKENP